MTAGLGLVVFGWPVANAGDHFIDYLDAPITPADGFDFPVGDKDGQGSYRDRQTGKVYRGWYRALRFGQEFGLGLHPGEDFNGRGGGDTDLGQPVYAVAAGRVVVAEEGLGPLGSLVIIEHLYYENHHKRRIRSVYAHLGALRVKPGQVVERRQVIGEIGRDPFGLFAAHLHLELRRDLSLPPLFLPTIAGKDRAWLDAHYAGPTRFIQSHRRLFVPQQEAVLVLVDSQAGKMQLIERGKPEATVEVAFGQANGRKRRRGDLKTPRGMYFVIHKHRGDFSGPYGAYYGGHWIKVNYPNAFDADFGMQTGLISEIQRKTISIAWKERKATSPKTRLGGGIGFHGWIDEWSDTGSRRLSWGCVVLHNADIRSLYDRIPVGSMVIVF